jgi:predicted transcriptional regulator
MDELLQLSKTLSKEGYEDVLFLSLVDARRVLTEKRLEIIQTIKDEEIESIRGLARKLDRKENIVYEDLRLLFEEGVIDFEDEGNRRIPVLRHENIWVRPITMKKKKVSA